MSKQEKEVKDMNLEGILVTLGASLLKMSNENYNSGTFDGVTQKRKDDDMAEFKVLHRNIQASEINSYLDFKKLVEQYHTFVKKSINRIPATPPSTYLKNLVAMQELIAETFRPFKAKLESQRNEILDEMQLDFQNLKSIAESLRERKHNDIADALMATFKYTQEQSKQYKLGNIDLEQFKGNIRAKYEEPEHQRNLEFYRNEVLKEMQPDFDNIKTKSETLRERGQVDYADRLLATYNYIQEQSTQFMNGIIKLDHLKENVRARLQSPAHKEDLAKYGTVILEEIQNDFEKLKTKAKSLEERGHTKVAQELMNTYDYTQEQSELFKADKISLEQFKGDVTAKLEEPDQVKLFNTHRGLKPIHKHLLLGLTTLGLGHLIGGAISKYKGKGFALFQEKRTKTQQEVDKTKAKVGEIEEKPKPQR